MSPKEYVSRFSNFIRKQLKGSALLPSIVMAHALYESADDEGYIGRSEHAALYNNDVRIRADRTWTGSKIRLPLRAPFGRKRKRMAWFRTYSAAEDAIADRITMLTHERLSWPKAFWYSDTLEAQAAMLQLSGIAADPRYGERIVHLVNKHKLYRYDLEWYIGKAKDIAIMLLLIQAGLHALQYWDVVVPWR